MTLPTLSLKTHLLLLHGPLLLCAVVPHVTNQIQDWVERVAQIPADGSGIRPDVCVIEVSSIEPDLLASFAGQGGGSGRPRCVVL